MLECQRIGSPWDSKQATGLTRCDEFFSTHFLEHFHDSLGFGGPFGADFVGRFVAMVEKMGHRKAAGRFGIYFFGAHLETAPDEYLVVEWSMCSDCQVALRKKAAPIENTSLPRAKTKRASLGGLDSIHGEQFLTLSLVWLLLHTIAVNPM